MRILDENDQERSEEELDMTEGCLVPGTVIRQDAAPIDNVTKYAWDNDDYEEVLRYVRYDSIGTDAWRDEQKRAAAEEVQMALITSQINTMAVDDTTALRWRMLYPEWAADVFYEVGVKVQHGDKLYRCLQGHTAQTAWEPENTPALWTEVCESHRGTVDDPIPYNGNAALKAGKYYSQGGTVYRCTRDTDGPVYNALEDLTGLYAETAA